MPLLTRMIKTFELETLFFFCPFYSATLAAFVTFSKSVDFIRYLLKFLNNLQQFIHSTQCFALGHPVNIVQIFAKNLLDTLWGVIPILLLFVQQITILMLFSFTNSWIQVNSIVLVIFLMTLFSVCIFLCNCLGRPFFQPDVWNFESSCCTSALRANLVEGVFLH